MVEYISSRIGQEFATWLWVGIWSESEQAPDSLSTWSERAKNNRYSRLI